MKALDFVRTPGGAIGLITETNNGGTTASITIIGPNTTRERNAWWDANELVVIDSLSRLLANEICHPFGRGSEDVQANFGKPGEIK